MSKRLHPAAEYASSPVSIAFTDVGPWRKRKGVATVRLPDGAERRAELHWYEATGIGRKELKIKRYLD